jgi:hypothetical protein
MGTELDKFITWESSSGSLAPERKQPGEQICNKHKGKVRNNLPFAGLDGSPGERELVTKDLPSSGSSSCMDRSNRFGLESADLLQLGL